MKHSATVALSFLAISTTMACTSTSSSAGGSGQTTTSTGGAGGAGQTSSAPTHAFAITITNASNETVFLQGDGLPFVLWQAQAALPTDSTCLCSWCGTGQSCHVVDPHPLAIELPAGGSLTASADLVHYAAIPAKDGCTADSAGRCDEPHAFDPGSYEIRVAYDSLEAIQSQGLKATGDLAYGKPVWDKASVPGPSVVSLSKEATAPLSLTGDASQVEVTITAAP